MAARKVRRIDFSPDEWLAGTAELSIAERGVYITACALIYSRGGPISEELLRATCRGDLRVFRRAVDRLLMLGKLAKNGADLVNKRCLSELEIAQKRVASAAENSAKSKRVSHKNNTVAAAGGAANAPANHQPSTINHQPQKLDASEEQGVLWQPQKEIISGVGGHSEPNGSGAPGAGAPLNLRDVFYGHCLAWLAKNTDKPPDKLRSLIGSWIKAHGKLQTLAAFDEAEKERPIDPIGWITRRLEGPSASRRNGHDSGYIPMHPGAGG